jgi:hypothetical protein
MAAFTGLILAVTSCGSGNGGSSPPQLPNMDAQLASDTAKTASYCDFLDAAYCLFPFPNDYYTTADTSTDTGLHVNLQTAALPISKLTQKSVDPSEWNRNDGFSPGPMLLTYVPGIDLQQSAAPILTNLPRSLDADSPIVMVDASTLEHQLIWAELDQNHVSGPDRQALIIRVAKNLDYGHRYIVALRSLKDASGTAINAGAAFTIYRDNHESDLDFVNARRAHMEDLFATLGQAGVTRSDLYLAWDFTVASERNLTSRVLHIRDDAFAAFTNGLPDFKVTAVTDLTPDQDPLIARRIEGVLTLPTYLNKANTEGSMLKTWSQFKAQLATGNQASQALLAKVEKDPVLSSVGTVFNYANNDSPGVNDLPQRIGNSTLDAPFLCEIPRSVLNSDGSVNPARIAVYGHGLFGSRTEITDNNVESMANEHNFVICGTNWYGFSQDDLPNALMTLLNLSNARSMFDTIQQGFVHVLALGRALKHQNGFTVQPAFQMGSPARSVLDTSALYWDSNSEGAILGGAIMSLTQDTQRGVLGVPGTNFSFLLERSEDFQGYSIPLYLAYPDSFDEEAGFSLIQMLFDRAEVNGYARKLTDDPLPNTPPHQVLLHPAFGDHQVSMWGADALARTIGAQLHCPAIEPNRHPDQTPYYGIPCMSDDQGGHNGSAMVVWDSGPQVLSPPTTNVAPTDGQDPHEDPRSTPSARTQKSDFLQPDGKVIDVCNGKPCGAVGYVPP